MPEPRVRLFISHGSEDAALAERLVRLIRSALNLPAQAIRATSVDGYRLPGGANVDDQLRREVLGADAFVGILSPGSLQSLYVLFELGARWGAGKPLVPLLTPGTPPEAVGRPLSGLNPLRADSAPQLHQLVAELSGQLGIDTQPVAAYHKDLEALLAGAGSQEGGAARRASRRPDPEVPGEAADLLLQLVKEQGLAAPQLASRMKLTVAKAESLAELLHAQGLASVAAEQGAPANYFITKKGRKYLLDRELIK